MPGEGMPEHNFASSKGDLVLDFEIEMPRALSQQQREGFRQVFAMAA